MLGVGKARSRGAVAVLCCRGSRAWCRAPLHPHYLLPGLLLHSEHSLPFAVVCKAFGCFMLCLSKALLESSSFFPVSFKVGVNFLLTVPIKST